MNGVNRADQLRTEYPSVRNSKKWWLSVWWFAYDLAVANAFILMKESRNHTKASRSGRQQQLRMVDFRRNLAKQLIGQQFSQYKRKRTSIGDPTSTAHMPTYGPRGRCRHCAAQGVRRECRVRCEGCNCALCLKCFAPFHQNITG